MNSRLLKFSVMLNLVLLGAAGYWIASNHSGGNVTPTPAPIARKNPLPESSPDLAATTLATTPATLRWSDIESDDYPTYIANLRKVGCPEPILRCIITADLKELYARKALAVVQEFHRDFWEIAARPNGFANTKPLASQISFLSKESDDLLRQLLGEAPIKRVLPRANRLVNFLPPAKQEQLRQLTERYDSRFREIERADLSPEGKAFQLTQLRREQENEQTQLLSSEEFAEYQLRQSSAATEVQQLYGVDFGETELRNLAKTIDDYHRRTDSEAEIDAQTLEQKLQTVLGPERLADLNRARSASYRELYDVASDFGLPSETAAEIFDLRLESEKRSEKIRADKNRPAEEKQALLDELEEQVEQAVSTKFGPGAYQSYTTRDGRWINSLGRL